MVSAECEELVGATSSTLMHQVALFHHIAKPLACQYGVKQMKGLQPFSSAPLLKVLPLRLQSLPLSLLANARIQLPCYGSILLRKVMGFGRMFECSITRIIEAGLSGPIGGNYQI